MAERTLTLPTTSALPSAHRVPPNDVSVQRTLSKVSRPALINLVQEWLRPHNLPTCRPVLGNAEDEIDSIYNLHQTLDEVRKTYEDFRTRRGNKREVVDRIVDGDWRQGVSLRQLAMADIQYLLEHPTSQRWVALKLCKARAPLKEIQQGLNMEESNRDKDGGKLKSAEKQHQIHLPRFEAPIFLHNLQSQIGSLLKAHYHLTHLPNLPLTLLRIAILDSPYNSQLALQETAADMWRTLFVAFPDNTPYVYVAISSALGGPKGPDGKSLRSLIIDAIPKAFSKPRERYTLESTAMSAKSLGALLVTRGSGRTNAAGGGWSVFAKGTVEGTPLMASTKEYEEEEARNLIRGNANIEANTSKTRKRTLTSSESTKLLFKKRRLIAEERFGASALPTDGQGIDKLSVRIEDAYPVSTPEQQNQQSIFLAQRNNTTSTTTKPAHSKSHTSHLLLKDPSLTLDTTPPPNEEQEQEEAGSWKPHVTITFHGTHVFAGIRSLVELGAVDGRGMPGWMTGEEGVSLGVVRGGKILRGRGDGA